MTAEEEQIQAFEEVFANLKEMLHLTDEIMIRLYTIFFKTVPATMKMLQEAIAVEDYDAIKSHAHSVKGSSSSLCYSTISEIAKTIEKNAEANEHYAYEQAFRELTAQFDAAQRNYTLWIGKRG